MLHDSCTNENINEIISTKLYVPHTVIIMYYTYTCVYR